MIWIGRTADGDHPWIPGDEVDRTGHEQDLRRLACRVAHLTEAVRHHGVVLGEALDVETHRLRLHGHRSTAECRIEAGGSELDRTDRSRTGMADGGRVSVAHDADSRTDGDRVRPGDGIIGGMRLGIAHHFGWAVAVTASADHQVVDRRRIELIEPGMATAPIHHEGKPLDDAAAAALVAQVRASAVRATSACAGRARDRSARTDRLDVAASLAARLPRGHRRPTSHALRGPGRLRHVPPGAGRSSHARAAGTSTSTTPRTWRPERPASWLSGPTTSCSGRGQRLGPPWAKDHRMALAATIMAGDDGTPR